MLRDLVKLENRPGHLTEMAYEWCSVICENRNLEDWESLLLVSLEIGFRLLDPQNRCIGAELTHTEHHRESVDIVFRSKESETIADILHAWTTGGASYTPAHKLLGTCASHLIGLHNMVPFSSRLRKLVIRSVGVIDHKGFEGMGVERFVDLLEHLHVTVEDISDQLEWADLLHRGILHIRARTTEQTPFGSGTVYSKPSLYSFATSFFKNSLRALRGEFGMCKLA